MRNSRREYLAQFGIAALGALSVITATQAASSCTFRNEEPPMFPGTEFDYHGFTGHKFNIDGCGVIVVAPKVPLPGNPWIWRTMFWDAFPSADIALLNRGYYAAFMDVGDTWGSPGAMAHFDAFYTELTTKYDLAKKTTLEGLSRGGMFAYRWATSNPDKVACVYGDAPVCSLSILLADAQLSSTDRSGMLQNVMQAYHFANEQEVRDYKGNPIDTLAPLAAAHVPLIHVCGDIDPIVRMTSNTDIVRERYLKMGGDFVLIVKQGCEHHPHGLSDPTPVVNFIVAHTAGGQVAADAAAAAPKPGSVTMLPKGKW